MQVVLYVIVIPAGPTLKWQNHCVVKPYLMKSSRGSAVDAAEAGEAGVHQTVWVRVFDAVTCSIGAKARYKPDGLCTNGPRLHTVDLLLTSYPGLPISRCRTEGVRTW